MSARTICFLCALLAGTGLAWPAAAQPAPEQPRRFAMSATVGVSRPVDSAMSDVYGNGLMPITAQIDVRLEPAISLFAGVRHLRADGQTVILGSRVADETYATSFRMTSARLGAQVAARVAPRVSLAAGAGVSIASYEETWPQAAQSVKDRATGFLALAEGRYAMNARWSVLGRVEYTTIPQSNIATGSNVNLGGVDVSAGVRVVF